MKKRNKAKLPANEKVLGAPTDEQTQANRQKKFQKLLSKTKRK